MSDRSVNLPCDLDAERTLLGAVLLGGAPTLEAVRGLLDAGDFYRDAHRLTFEELCAMAAEGAPLELPALIARVPPSRIGDFGGGPYLAALPDAAPSAESATHYAEQVRKLAEQRRAILAIHDLEARVRAGDPIPPALLAEGSGPGWPLPAPLDARGALPPFPVDGLPWPFSHYVSALATATQTPVDLPGVLVLAALATACAGKGRVEAGPGWQEPLNVYVTVALPPANRKSEVFRRVLEPIRTVEREEAARAAPELARAAEERAIRERRLEVARARAVKAEGDERAAAEGEARELAAELAQERPPCAPRYLCDDVTPERLAGLLAEHSGRIALWSEEGGPFEIMAGRYSAKGEPRLEVFLKAHDGGALRVDRMGRAAEQVDRPALTMGLAVQPPVLAGLARREGMRDRGLLGRFLYALPSSLVGRRSLNPPPVPDTLAVAYGAALVALLAREVGEDERLHLDVWAARALEGFRTELEPRLHEETGDLGAVADWSGKLAGQVVRLAGLLHLAEHAHAPDPWGIPVSGDTMVNAIRLGDYFIPHALAVFSLMGADPAHGGARRVLAWIDREGRTGFAERDAFNAVRSTFGTMERFRPALRLLEEHGFIRRLAPSARSGPGRKPSPAFEVNPRRGGA